MFIESLKLKTHAVLQLKNNPESEDKLDKYLSFNSTKEADREVSTFIF